MCACAYVCVFERPCASCLTSSCSLCSDSALPCLGPGPKVKPAPRSVDPQLQLRDGRFVCLRGNAPPNMSLKMGSTVGCLRPRWRGTEHVSRGSWHQTQLSVIQKKVILSAIPTALEISCARGARKSVCFAAGKTPRGYTCSFLFSFLLVVHVCLTKVCDVREKRQIQEWD